MKNYYIAPRQRCLHDLMYAAASTGHAASVHGRKAGVFPNLLSSLCRYRVYLVGPQVEEDTYHQQQQAAAVPPARHDVCHILEIQACDMAFPFRRYTDIFVKQRQVDDYITSNAACATCRIQR